MCQRNHKALNKPQATGFKPQKIYPVYRLSCDLQLAAYSSSGFGSVSRQEEPFSFNGFDHPLKGLDRVCAFGKVILANRGIPAAIFDFENIDAGR